MRVSFLAASVALAALTAGAASAAPKPADTAPNAVAAPAPAAADAAKPDAHAAATASQSTAAADASFTPASIFVATAPAHADPTRTYAHPSDAILAADLDYLVRHAHTELATGDQTAIWPVLAFSNAFASNDLTEARSVLEHSPGGKAGALGDLFEPFLLAAEGHVDQATARALHANDDMPAPLPDVQRALVLEGAGRLQDAAAVYADMEGKIDPTPPEGEPANMEEFQRTLAATRITHALYRAALVQHRLGHAQDARRLYGLVSGFAPHSADVERNLQRLAHNEPPFEPALTEQSAAGRWMLFLSDYISQSESLAQVMATRGAPQTGLSSPTGALFSQIGVTLAPDAQDWRLYAAQQLMGAGPTGLDGAERVINLMPSDSVFAPDAEIVKAAIQLQRHNDQAAFADAQHAQQLGGERWSVIASAGDVYRSTGHTTEAVAAFDRALTMVSTPKDRASVLGYRAFAHQFGGQQPAATADMRAALAADPSDNTKELFVSIAMDDPTAWHDGIQVARELFSADPNSVSRLNSLGYALIQHPEGLEEGYRLLWRGFNFGQQDYAVVDSLGWAYYLYGQFDQARALCERARDLSVNDPNPEILDHLGDIYWRLNRRDDARAQWRHALDARPDMPRQQRLTAKVAHGLTTAAPAHRDPPQVDLPTNPGQRSTT